MSTKTRCLLLLLIINTCSGEHDFTCDQQLNEKYLKEFPHFLNPKVTLEFSPISCSYEIKCVKKINLLDFIPESETILDYKTLKLKVFAISSCFLNITVKELMTRLKIDSVRKIYISDTHFNQTNRRIFAGLEDLDSLIINSNNFSSFPSEITEMENLTNLDISHNDIIIPQTILKKTKDKLQTLNIAGNQLTENDTGIFDDFSNLITLYMFQMNIETLNENMFRDLTQLNLLELSINQIETLPRNIFQELINLQWLSLRKNRILEISEDIFDYNRNLTKLQLDESFVENVTIPERIFWNLKNLQQLDLYSNSFKTLPRNLFKNLTSLQVLQLNDNQLETLPVLSHLKNLKSLVLAKNRLKITNDAFQGLENIKSLNLNSNQLSMMSSQIFEPMSYLEELDLSKNQLTLQDDHISQSAIRSLMNLRSLKLDHNNIQEIFYDWRVNFLNLKLLDLSYNNFTKLSNTDFEFLQNDIRVNLENNNIHQLNIDYFEYNLKMNLLRSKTLVININNNPLHCSCNLYNLYRYFNGKIDLSIDKYLSLESDELECATPKSMRGKPVKNIKSDEFFCNMLDDEEENVCPNNGICYFRPFTNTLVIDESYKNINDLPELNFTTIYGVDVEKVNIELNVSGNNLREFPKQFSRYENVIALDLSNNNLTTIEWLPQNLKVLDLHNNDINVLNSTQLVIINSTNLENIILHDNPWTCDCDAVDLLKYFQNNNRKVHNPESFKCVDTDLPILNLTIEDLCPSQRVLIIYISVTLALLSLISAIFVMLFYRYNVEIKVWLYAHQMFLWFITEEELDKDKIYDAFISYSHKDEEFIINEILPKLETGPKPYKLCLHLRNWQPGELITTNITRSILESRRTLVVLSTNFLESEWGKIEFKMAHVQGLNEGRARVIVILYGEVPMDNLDEELKAYLSTNTYVKWGDPWFWDKLRYALPHNTKYMQQAFPMDMMKNEDRMNLTNDFNSISESSDEQFNSVHEGSINKTFNEC